MQSLMEQSKTARENLAGMEIVRPDTPKENSDRAVSEDAAHVQKMGLIAEEEDKKVQKMIDQIKNQTDKHTKDYEQKKAVLTNRLAEL